MRHVRRTANGEPARGRKSCWDRLEKNLLG
jgi:hypothetical protein